MPVDGLRRHHCSPPKSPPFLHGFRFLVLLFLVLPFQMAFGISSAEVCSSSVMASTPGQVPYDHLSTSCLVGQRVGEARHPGPQDTLLIGSTNPGGLRSRELLAVEQGPGIWTYAETQLSRVTQHSSAKALRHHATQASRHLRVHHSAPAALRARSTWAGSWTGVTCTSDFSSKKLQVNWPQDVWESGRVLATQHYIGQHIVTMVSVYGLPKGPTWPKAASITNDITDFILREFIIGHAGLVCIAGDFNFGPRELPSFDAWRAYGFCSAQDLAAQRWLFPAVPTCKGSTERDLIWLSPMAQSLCSAVRVAEVFQDHASIMVELNIDVLQPGISTWPRPREIPWGQVHLEAWHEHCTTFDLQHSSSSTETMKGLAKSYEQSLNGFIRDFPSSSLSSAHCGRAQRLEPAHLTPTPRSCRASRPGEETLVADTVSKAVILWFKQLRRLQSYQHSIKAGHVHPAAVQYRIELWSSIRRARGFDVSFEAWWSQQDFAQAVGPFPMLPPDAHVSDLIYQAFHHAFRTFERWHLQQRLQVLQARYDKTMRALFQDLRQTKPDQVDAFWNTISFEVVAVKHDTASLLLNQPIPPHQHGQRFFQGRPLVSCGFVEEMLVLDFLPEITCGDCLELHVHTSQASEVHQQLSDFWIPRWNCQEALSDDVWLRVTRFVARFMPKVELELPPLTVDMWMTALRRFRPSAARGADGWARDDLLNMPRAHTELLLSLLTDIEHGRQLWPQQLQEGLVIALAKCEGAHRPNEYRPIVLLSIIYRCWASLRSRQMLHMLEPWIHADAHGFLPSREPAQTWVHVQAAVELSLQSSLPLAGVGTDFVKAFNCIRREPLWLLAEAVGIPSTLLHPWKGYVSSFTRRFVVCNHVSAAHSSSQGFAEGCPLSVLAMALIDWGYQVYQQHYAPRVRHFSFVDNISMLAREAQFVAWAFFTLRAYLTMWGLTLDLGKSYAWGTTPSLRRQLAQLGVKMVVDFSELGGALSFTAAHRVRLFLQKGESLHAKWLQLRRSRAPLAQKLVALPMVFWAKALHGALSCVFAASYLTTLRTQAVKHLGVQLAGANPLLRLSLAQPPTADPGFYQLRTAIFDFRRLCRKSPDLLQFWQIFMERFEGVIHDGPFSKLVTLLNGIGWQICRPPLLQDHDGSMFDLLTISHGALEALLLDGWFQFVATQVRHKTMTGLQGIDVALTLLDHDRQPPQTLARVRALQTGAFVSSWQHAKYDKTKQPICQHCLVPDTQSHWLCCPRFAAQRTNCGDLVTWIHAAPQCLALHLLVPRSPFVILLKEYFLALPDTSCSFQSRPRRGVVNHVFTDGSFFRGVVPCLDRASWAVVNASTGQSISHGWVPGLSQTIGRAELWGLISAIEWAVKYDTRIILWTDSAGTWRKACRIQSGGASAIFDGENDDLWRLLADALSRTVSDQIDLRWTPSHIEVSKCDDVVEEFLATWNDIVDQHALATNQNRGPAFAQLLHQAETYYQLWTQRLHDLRDFYLQVADARQEPPEIIDLTSEPAFFIQRIEGISLGDALPVNWQQHLVHAQASLKVPVEFVLSLFQICVDHEPMQPTFEAVSFVELTLWAVQFLGAQFPAERSTDGHLECKSVYDMLLRPTLAALVQKLKLGFVGGLKILGLDNYLCRQITRHEAGIAIPVDGLVVRAVSMFGQSEESRWVLPITGKRKLSLDDLQYVNDLRRAVSDAFEVADEEEGKDAAKDAGKDKKDKSKSSRECRMYIKETPETIKALGYFPQFDAFRLVSAVGKRHPFDEEPTALHGVATEGNARFLGDVWIDMGEDGADDASSSWEQDHVFVRWDAPLPSNASGTPVFLSFEDLGKEVPDKDAAPEPAPKEETAASSQGVESKRFAFLPELSLSQALKDRAESFRSMQSEARELLSCGRPEVRSTKERVKHLRRVAKMLDTFQERSKSAWHAAMKAEEPFAVKQAMNTATKIMQDLSTGFAEVETGATFVREIHQRSESRKQRAESCNLVAPHIWATAVKAARLIHEKLSFHWRLASAILKHADASKRSSYKKADDTVRLVNEKLLRWKEEAEILQREAREDEMARQASVRQGIAPRMAKMEAAELARQRQDSERQRMQAMQWGRHLVQPLPMQTPPSPDELASKAAASPAEPFIVFAHLGCARVDYWRMIRSAAALFALCAGTDVQVVDMYRAMKKPDGGKETRKVVVRSFLIFLFLLQWKYGIDAIARYRVQVKNPSGVEAGAPVPGFGSMFSAFDFGVATNDDALKELAKVGDFVGVQLHSQDDASIIVAYPYYWFSLPGSCPNLPWRCIPGAKQTSCQTKRSDLEVMPPVCADSGCAGKKDDAALKCVADFSKPDTMSGCCLRYGPKNEAEVFASVPPKCKRTRFQHLPLGPVLLQLAAALFSLQQNMGTKAAVMYAFCSVFALVLQSIATQIKWHALRFMSGITTHTLMKMETGLLYTRVDTGSSLLCFYRDAAQKDVSRLKPSMCDRLSEGITLQDAADEWCAPLLMSTFPSPCEGFKAAYFLGLGTLLAMAINVVAIVVCLFLIAQYLEGTLHKGVYRVWALILHITSTVILIAVYVVYIMIAITALDEVGGHLPHYD
eukprot:s241_g24.t1